MAKSSNARAMEQVEFGGVDSRSNPLNMPTNRALRNLNWTVKSGGWLELRPGYTTVSQSTITSSAIHSLIPFTLFDQTKYVVRFQGMTPYLVAIATGTVTSPTFGTGASFSSSTPGQSFFYNNHLYYGNGTDQLYFDGVTWRPSGLRAPTTAEVAPVTVYFGSTGEMTPVQRAGVALAQSAGGSFPVQSQSGMLFYVTLFNPPNNEWSPTTQPVASGRIQISTLNNKVTITGLPDESAIGVFKLISRTDDGTAPAYFCTTAAAVAIQTVTRSGSTVTVNATAHGRATGDVLILAGVGDANYNNVWSITVVSANQFTFKMFAPAGVASTSGGTLAPILTVAAATLTVDVTSTLQDKSILVNDPNRGIATSTIGGTNPGFQFYLAIARVVNGSVVHVGNRVAVGLRIVPTTRSILYLQNLPTYADPEWQLMVGRTSDGLVIPYASVDTAGANLLVPNGQTSILVTTWGTIDGNQELPFRNTVIPATCDKFAVVGDYVYAADSISPTIRRSGSAVKARNGQFLGDLAQSWATNDIDTFPTNQTPVLLAETEGMLFVATRSDCAFLVDNLGIPMWLGPYTKGAAGPRASVRTDHGFYWVSWDKELCTVVDGKPISVSDEYDTAELAQLGDAFKTKIELQYFRSTSLDRDELVIFGQKSDGTPHKIVVDFKLLDARSPWGQGRGEEYLGPLATVYTTVMIVDANNIRQLWAGGSVGNIYLLYSGGDDVGTQFTADTVFLKATGLERLQVGSLDFFGDGNVVVSYGLQLNSTLDAGLETDLIVLTPLQGGAPMQVPGRFDQAAWRVPLSDPEQLGHTYLRFQLTSHPIDGNLTLSNPPHLPLETYGRVYLVAPLVGEERGRA